MRFALIFAAISRVLAPLRRFRVNCSARRCENSITDGISMKIHEYQAKAILARYGVTTPRGEVAFTKEEAREAAHRLRSHSHVIVVKAQIHAGGRGKGGGVKLARSSDEAAELASHMLGMKLVTHQTGPG